jgi:diacylglycerol kinase family enzyme
MLILFNPISGGGRAERAAGNLATSLRAAGHTADLVATRREPDDDWLAQRLADVSLLVVVGGDGTVRAAAGAAIRTRTPLYHVPFGTANLFAREFGMDRHIRTLYRAIDHFTVRWVDTGVADGEGFVLMASVGYDAEVVHDLAAHRGRSISYLSYAGPLLRQLRRWQPATMSLVIDGRSAGGPPTPGTVVVANARGYAFGLNPARNADMADGLLDVVFFPTASRWQLLTWLVKLRLGGPLEDPAMVVGRGATVQIECDRPQRLQLDGDAPVDLTARTLFSLSVRPRVLPILEIPDR